MPHFSYKNLTKSSKTRARRGVIETPRGSIQTPVFMPVGTQATVKAIRPEELKAMGADIVLANTYHLFLRPGHETIQALGGLHRFMNWPAPVLTDSGGFQVYSLGREARLKQVPKDDVAIRQQKTRLAQSTDEGVWFQSHIDGQKNFMSPESSIAIQEALGADIMMAFDECIPYPASFSEAQQSMKRSLDWEKRSLAASVSDEQALFGIVQGGMHVQLRKECAERLTEISEGHETGNRFSGYALGGFSVGEPISEMYEMVARCVELLPKDQPRYLMGVGMPEDLVTMIDLGIDMFDCVIPTRNARNGMLFTPEGSIQIKQARYAADGEPIDRRCSCYTCRSYSRAYLRHLHMAKEILSSILSSIHNLHYYLNLLSEARLAIEGDSFGAFKSHFFNQLERDL
jgi:queuine tRNA-ribosyltransferase